MARLGRGHPAGGHGDERRCAGPALEMGALAQQRTRPVLGQALAVDLDAEHAVEDQEYLGAPVTLADEGTCPPSPS